ncbi:MAG: hypothetical protein ACREM1_03370 [Longimicrobiales bacterium]
MYPAHAFQLFPPFPREDEVFVAMSFDPRFETRWKQVIEPAIRSVKGHDGLLRPHRVDARTVSDSILTDILQGISRARLVFADITYLGRHDDYIIRNGNVMYEIGIAHATRLLEEVLLFRSDNERLLFDVAGIRVRNYTPEGDPDSARQQLSTALVDALRELDVRRAATVQQAVSSLSYDEILVLFGAANGFKHPRIKTYSDAVATMGTRSTISRMLDRGLLETRLPKLTPEVAVAELDTQGESSVFEYHLTPFGHAVLRAAADQFGFTATSPEEWQARVDALRQAKEETS